MADNTLEILPDRFSSDVHKKLDNAINEAAAGHPLLSSPLTSLGEYLILLNYIVTNSDDQLDHKYTKVRETRELIDTHPDLQEKLSTAWENKSYSDIRNLAILQKPRPTAEQLPEPTTVIIPHDLLSQSFETTYRGAAVDGFYEYLTLNEKRFKTKRSVSYYARFCSIVQSSGTGKSRMITELSKKDVVVIYINLRSKLEVSGFPERDSIPSGILTEFPATQQGYQATCYAFFTALFQIVAEYLSKSYALHDAKDEVINWARRMCDMSSPSQSSDRTDFFCKVNATYQGIYGDILRDLERRVSARVSPGEVGEAADNPKGPSISGEPKASSSKSDSPAFVRLLLDSYRKMTEYLEKIFADNSDRPKLVIAFDEAHLLAVTRRNKDGAYRPASILCRIVSEYSRHGDHAVWVVFASTTSKVADFSPPNQKYNSDCVASGGQVLFAPYTQLGWDQSASELGDIDVEDISRVEHIAGYGRPLWLSLKDALGDTESVLDTATNKLCGGSDVFKPQETSHVLAVLGQRFGLDIALRHPDSVEHLETGISSHLRVCLATTRDRNWRFTSYPSEPLLSCVAAIQLHDSPERMDIALDTLLVIVNSGMIDMGQRGELASRLLWLLAKDLFIRTAARGVVTAKPSTWMGHLADCQMICVVDWLKFIFGPQVWDGEDTGASMGRKAFENAYLNFSHWVCMDGNISGSEREDCLSLDEWTQCHWQRTSAVQCCHLQPLVDKVIPIYFRGDAETASVASRMSHIFISDKARKSKNSKDALRYITQRSKHIRGSDGKLPYIAILADLGQPASFSVTFPKREVADQCLRICAAGVDTMTYPFLDRYPTLMKTLQNLVRLQQIPEAESPVVERLDKQVKFGSTVAPEHMYWGNRHRFPSV